MCDCDVIVCDSVAGAKQLGESGYWTLSSLAPPEPTPAMKAGSKVVKQGVEGEGDGKRVSILDTPVVMEVMMAPCGVESAH